MSDDDSPQLTRDIAPFGVRMPADLKERVQAAAKANGRSTNAEIVATLEEKYPTPSHFDKLRDELLAAKRMLRDHPEIKPSEEFDTAIRMLENEIDALSQQAIISGWLDFKRHAERSAAGQASHEPSADEIEEALDRLNDLTDRERAGQLRTELRNAVVHHQSTAEILQKIQNLFDEVMELQPRTGM